VSEWIVRDLGGATAAEPSLASRTAALAIADRAWWPEAISWAGLSPDVFAPLRQAGAHWGTISDGILGLESIAGAALTAAGHDHLVAAVGSGLTSTGQVMDSCGTAEALLRPVPADPALDLAAVVARDVNCGWHVLPGVYNLIVGLRLGLDLAPLLQRLGSASSGGRTPLDGDALVWLTRDEAAGGNVEDAVRAWADAIRRAVDGASHALEELRDLGGPIDEVLIGGGWAANPVLQALKRTAFPHPAYPQVAEPGVRGAALLAGQAAGAFAAATDFPAPPLQRIPDAQEIPVP
jgi:sugar (pentulose or hexulose) kinase